MRWYLASRRLRSLLLVVVLFALISALAGGLVLTLPGIVPGPPLSLPAALLLPSLCSSAVVAVFSADRISAEVLSSRPLRLLDHGSVLALVLVASATLAAAAVIGHAPQLFGAARNVVAFAGVALFLRPVAGDRYVVVVPALATLAIAALGAPVRNEGWFWFLREASASSWAGAAALLLVGTLVSLAATRGTPTRRS
jgi:hypothetical protein